MKKLIGQVTSDEKEAIKVLFERKNGLIELSKIVDPDNEKLYNKLVVDLGKTTMEFQQWWDTVSQKYNWESIDGHNWEIDFNDCNIYIVKS
jgi:CXXX repeat modification system protein